MTEISVSAFMALAAGRSGHFCMESGLHSALWLDLDALFASPIRVEPFISVLADLLRPFRVAAVCGPLLGGAFLAQRVAQRIGAEFWYTEPVHPLTARVYTERSIVSRGRSRIVCRVRVWLLSMMS